MQFPVRGGVQEDAAGKTSRTCSASASRPEHPCAAFCPSPSTPAPPGKVNRYIPLVPLHILLPDQSPQISSQRTTREGNRKLAALLDGIALRLDDKVGERVCCMSAVFCSAGGAMAQISGETSRIIGLSILVRWVVYIIRQLNRERYIPTRTSFDLNE